MSKQLEVLYHCCSTCYYDGTLPLISKKGGCSIPTVHPFWKDPEDVKNSVKTRRQKRVAPFIEPKLIDAYFDHKHEISSRYKELINSQNTDNESTD